MRGKAMFDFKRLATLPLPKEPLTATAPRALGVGSDSDQYVTIVADPAATARAICAAATKARNGDDTAPKLSAVAQQIIDSGKRRRGEI
jgi:hypothetical protein